MLDSHLKGQLQAYLEHIKYPIEITAWLDQGAPAREMSALLAQISALSDRIVLRERHDDTERTPSFGIARAGSEPRIRFAGIPLGHEFTTLVLALLHVGGHPPKVSAQVIERIGALPGGLRFESVISLACQNCPDVVQALNLLAAIHPNIHHTMIDGALFLDEVNARQVMAVPAVFLNGTLFGQGRMSLEEILAKLDAGAGAREVAKLDGKAPFDVLVVGGGPAGAAAAIYAARKGIRTGIVAERFGGQLLDTLGIENLIAVQHTEGAQLAAALEQHVKAHDVDVIAAQRAAVLLPGELLELQLESGARLKAKAVVLATGARWRALDVPGEQAYRNRGVAYCPHCDGPLFKGKRVAVIGGGNSGVEAAIDLAGIVAQVTLLEYDVNLRADAVLQRKLRSLPNVTVITHAQTTEVLGDGAKVTGLDYTDRGTGAARHLDLDGVFVQIGLLPNTEWLRGTLALTDRGEIEIDHRGQTSLPGVFAAGDATTVPYKQIVIALGEGSKAALGAFDHLIRESAPAEPSRMAA